MSSPVRRAWTLAVLATVVACAGAPKIDITAEQATLRARSDSLEAAESAMDQAKSVSFWAPDAIIQPAGTPQVQGHDAIAALYKQYFEASGLKAMQGKGSTLTMAASADLAFETGVNRMTFKGPKGDLLDVGKYILVWQKTNGTWYVAALSFTSDAAAPVPVAAPK